MGPARFLSLAATEEEPVFEDEAEDVGDIEDEGDADVCGAEDVCDTENFHGLVAVDAFPEFEVGLEDRVLPPVFPPPALMQLSPLPLITGKGALDRICPALSLISNKRDVRTVALTAGHINAVLVVGRNLAIATTPGGLVCTVTK